MTKSEVGLPRRRKHRHSVNHAPAPGQPQGPLATAPVKGPDGLWRRCSLSLSHRNSIRETCIKYHHVDVWEVYVHLTTPQPTRKMNKNHSFIPRQCSKGPSPMRATVRAGTAAPPAAWQASYIPKTIGNPEVQRCHASFYQNLTF